MLGPWGVRVFGEIMRDGLNTMTARSMADMNGPLLKCSVCSILPSGSQDLPFESLTISRCLCPVYQPANSRLHLRRLLVPVDLACRRRSP